MPEVTRNEGAGSSARAFARFDSALDRCRSDLAVVAADAPVRQMFGPVVRLSGHARRTGVPPEKLLAALKELLGRTPKFAALDPSERDDATEKLVNLSIEVFYENAPRR
ncbi:MAG TPA: hypothetical protein VIP11_10585 [Gemmatimonadaceae bacterium]